MKTSKKSSTKGVLERIADPFFALDEHYCFTYINEKFEELLGKTSAELIGKQIWIEFPAKFSASFKSSCYGAVESQQPITFAEFNPFFGGWFEHQIYPSMDGISVISRNISKRKITGQDNKQENRELTILNTIATAISQSIDLPVILNIALVETISTIGCDGGILYTYDSHRQLFNPETQYGISPEVLREFGGFKFGQGLSGSAAESGNPLIVADLAADKRNLSQTAIRENWHGFASIPIKTEKRVIGVMTLVSHQTEFFNTQHIPVLQHIGNQIGLAIQKTQINGAFDQELIERKRVESELEERQQLLGMMSRMAKIGAWEFDAVTMKGTWTEETARIHDLDPADETNVEKGLSFYCDESRPKIEAAIKAAIETGESYDLELELISAKGNHKWVRTIGQPILKDSQVIKIQGTFQDITERKQAENELKQLNLFLNSIIEQSPYAMWIADEKGTLVRINQACCQLLNITPEEVIEKYNILNDNIVKEQGFLPLVQSVFEEGKTARFELHYDTTRLNTLSLQGSSDVILDVTIFPIKNGGGRITNAVIQHMDITIRKRAEEALRESEAKYRLLAESMSDTVWLMDMDLDTIYISPSVTRLRGFTLEEINNASRQQQMTPDSLTRAMDLLSYAISPENLNSPNPNTHFSVELEFYRKDGTKFWSDNTFTLILDQNGRPANILGIGRDITEKKLAENALLESEARFRSMFEESPIAYQSLDEQGCYTDVNPALCDLLGYEANELIGRCFSDLWAPDKISSFQKVFDEFKKTGTTRGDLQLIRKDGTPFEVILEGRIQRGSDGKFVRTHCVLFNITQRKQAEEKLRQSEDKFSKAFQSSPNIILIARLSDGKFIDANDTFISFSGYTRHEILGHTRQELNLWVDSDALERYLNNLQSDQHVREMETRFQTKSGQIIDCLVSGDVFMLDNEPCVLSTILDVTDRKRQEEQIERQMQRLASLRTIDSAIASSFDIRVTLGILLDHVTTQLKVDAAAVLSLNPYLNSLEFVAQRGFLNPGITRQRIHLGEELAGQAALERRLVSVPEISQFIRPLALTNFIKTEGFAAYFAAPLVVKGQVKGVLEVFHRSPLNPDAEWFDFLETIAGQTAIAMDNAELFQGLQRSNTELILAYDATIEGWSAALDLRDKETEGHSQRVLEMTLRMARVLGITDEELVHIRRGALLHDIGKLGVSDKILLKAGSLTDEEWEIMHQHPLLAYEMLAPIDYLRPALDIPYCHHEKWDGTGYPRGLKGGHIPLSARIFALVDVWDALRSDRPYRLAWSEDKALEYIRNQSGKHFDPQVVEAFFNLMEQDKLLDQEE